MSNNTFSEIARTLNEANSILIFPHSNVDGDALGSAVAMCKALRKMDKTVFILMGSPIPLNLEFLDQGYCTWNQDIIENPDLCFCIDCGDTSRFEKCKDKFLTGKKTLCVDHHKTSETFCDVNYIDPDAPATGQIVFNLLKYMKVEPDSEIGEAIFAAITTDTGDFQYSNTNKESHLIAAELYDWGIDANKVSVEIYENDRLERILIQNKTMDTLCTLGNGKIAMAFTNQEMLKATGARMDETESIVEVLRSISGVEIAAFLKEYEPEVIKVSLRAKRNGDVSKIAAKFNGGGHTKAAGFTINDTLSNAFDMVKKELMNSLKEL